MTENHCNCCGCEFNDDLVISGCNPFYGGVPNPLLDGKLCMWCAFNVEYSVIYLCLGIFSIKSWKSADGKTWSKENVKEWPEIETRRAYLKASHFKMLADYSPTAHNPCPRCSANLVSKESMSLLGEKYFVVKCEVCGYCD
jgi:hypothetical protein